MPSSIIVYEGAEYNWCNQSKKGSILTLLYRNALEPSKYLYLDYDESTKQYLQAEKKENSSSHVKYNWVSKRQEKINNLRLLRSQVTSKSFKLKSKSEKDQDYLEYKKTLKEYLKSRRELR